MHRITMNSRHGPLTRPLIRPRNFEEVDQANNPALAKSVGSARYAH